MIDPIDALLLQADALEVQARALRALAAAMRTAPASSAPVSSAPAPLLTASECARALGVSLPTLNRRVNEGAIPVVRIGDSRRYDLAAVRAALAGPAPAAVESAGTAEPPATSGVRRVSVGGRRAR